MSSHQMNERQVLEAVMAEAIRDVFNEYVDRHGLAEIAEVFAKGVRIEVGDMLPSAQYAERMKRVPPAWDKALATSVVAWPTSRRQWMQASRAACTTCSTSPANR